MNIRNMFLLIAVLFTSFTVNCWGGDSLVCAQNFYIATYTNEFNVTFQINPENVFYALYESKQIFCWNVYESKKNYENLRFLTSGKTAEMKKISPCYEQGTSVDLENNLTYLYQMENFMNSIKTRIRNNGNTVFTCKPCPDGGKTKNKTSYNTSGEWTAFNTIADCYTDTFTDETGTFKNKVQLSNSSYSYQECNYAE